MSLLIRAERSSDHATVFEINSSAFPGDDEANLVESLRQQAEPLVSLVAEKENVVVGHLMLSPATLDSAAEIKLMGLAPMAVVPGLQNQGIGSALVKAGLQCCRELKIAAIVVLGHPEFYPRFGFQPAVNFKIASEYDVPAEVFLVLELQTGALQKRPGTISYHPAFSAL